MVTSRRQTNITATGTLCSRVVSRLGNDHKQYCLGSTIYDRFLLSIWITFLCSFRTWIRGFYNLLSLPLWSLRSTGAEFLDAYTV